MLDIVYRNTRCLGRHGGAGALLHVSMETPPENDTGGAEIPLFSIVPQKSLFPESAISGLFLNKFRNLPRRKIAQNVTN